ncbi:MAG: hypothetical protein P1U53_06885 [Sulfitobacter sp.]|uniref:hypothetical protein n=1 Tax=Antarcticimicrobium sp. TaxID=2824147 RepID=UPI0026046BBD|nr:hypothetical protein [Antarcticimicrobium sp.]MDF1718517.1 hypothetical protein [Antarcticimicrobium sp.]MDF1727459.1 hypothetical protein [Sulfitobacter sp.]
MKPTAPLAALTVLTLAAPALAHEGAHLHPHGIGAGTLLLLGSVIAAGLVAVAVKVRK